MTTDVGDALPGNLGDADASAPPSATGGRSRVLAGRYVVGSRIGAGGMATILRGEDPQMERPVAIKVLHTHLADDPEVRRRFVAEARHAASLSHPNIVTIYDQGETDLPWIVMELVEGPSLRDVLTLHGPLSAAEMLAVVEPLADALQAAHQLGLVHRDVKPENVLISPDGMPKLVDFGIARVMAATSHTAAGTMIGSVHYMAPELVDGVEASPASDQYALGVMAFELLTGRKPLPADTPMAIALRHANEPVPAPSSAAEGVPAGVDQAIVRATARHPADRFDDIAAFGAALAGSVDEDPAPVTHEAPDGHIKTLIIPSAHMPTSSISTPSRTSDGEALSPAAAELRARREDREPPTASTGSRSRRRAWGRRLAQLLLTLLVLGVGGLGGWLAWTELIAPPIPVGDLVGLTRAEAFSQLEADGLTLRILSERNELEVPAGVVLGQDPPPGVELAEGDVVGVHLSLGPAVIEMPELRGRALSEVESVVATHAFRLDTTEAHDDVVPAGQVISQNPPPGVGIAEGSQVQLVVSLGIEQVTVPQLVNLAEQEAIDALTVERLDAQITRTWSDEVPEPGVVISQGTLAGLEVDALTAVELVISRGRLTLETPDLRGMSVDDALAAIAELEEIEPETFSQPVPTLGPFVVGSVNRVERQEPSPGQPIQRGATLTIYYFTQ